jgi:hypothetical protein
MGYVIDPVQVVKKRALHGIAVHVEPDDAKVVGAGHIKDDTLCLSSALAYVSTCIPVTELETHRLSFHNEYRLIETHTFSDMGHLASRSSL